MGKNVAIGMLSTAVVVLIGIVIWQANVKGGDEDVSSSPNSEELQKPTITPPTPMPTSVERELPPPKKNVVERIPSETDEPQTVMSVFEASGKGTYAKWGVAAEADMYYALKLVATSKIESKEQSESGKVRIQEIRSFKEAKEIIKPAKVQLRVDLSTVPIDQIENAGHLVGGLVSLFDPTSGIAISTAVSEFRQQVDSLDGSEGRTIIDMLGRFGIDIEKIVNEPIEQYLNKLLDEVHSHVNAVQGKSYRFVYWTDKEGEPLRVRYENVDRSPITVEEQRVLNYVNLFIDCHVLPDKSCRPGDCWNMDASAIASMFGVMTGGTCVGDVKVTRGNDLPDGNWNLAISPATVTVYSENKRPMGNVKINGGKAVGDAHKAVLREFQIDGKGVFHKYDKETRFWFFEFGIKIEGDCEFRSTLMPHREG